MGGGGSEKWSVTYTKHVKQKRKIYQDGFLELDALSHKVTLYDECDSILHSRFVKKDDVIKSGESLAFDCYLVDIGDLHGHQKPLGDLHRDQKPLGDLHRDQKPLPKFNMKVTMRSKSFQSPKLGKAASVNRTPKLGTDKECMKISSPSQKIIREFKKSEMNKYGSSPGSFETKQSTKMEWQVLYTTHITQKAKKYHDGILQLLIRGSQKQILLHDANRRLLNTRFLKKDETIRSGESITFDSHLVDVGETEGDNKSLVDSTLEERNCNGHGGTQAGCENIHSRGKYPIGPQEAASPRKHFNSNTHCSIDRDNISGLAVSKNPVRAGHQGDPRKHFNSGTPCSPHQHNISGLGVGKRPIRAAQDILSILRKPMTQKDAAETERQSRVEYNASQSSHVYSFDIGNQREQQPLQDTCPEGRKSVDLNEESTMHKLSSETSKTEVFKVLPDEINRLDQEFLTPGFSSGSGCISDMIDTGCTNAGETFPDHPTAGFNLLVPVELDSKWKQPISPVLQDFSADIMEEGHCTKRVSYIQPFDEVEPKNITQQCADSEQIDSGQDTGVHVIGPEKSNDCMSHDFSGDKLKLPEKDICTKKEDDIPSFDLGF